MVRVARKLPLGFYKTQEQCQWTASGIGGCALNPRLLFPNKPRDSNLNLLSHMK
jgi:hypothetical protein